MRSARKRNWSDRLSQSQKKLLWFAALWGVGFFSLVLISTLIRAFMSTMTGA